MLVDAGQRWLSDHVTHQRYFAEQIGSGTELAQPPPLPTPSSGLRSDVSGFLRMLFGLFPDYIPYMWKTEISICRHVNDASKYCLALCLTYL